MSIEVIEGLLTDIDAVNTMIFYLGRNTVESLIYYKALQAESLGLDFVVQIEHMAIREEIRGL